VTIHVSQNGTVNRMREPPTLYYVVVEGGSN
jgi:hypothetical protein